MNPKTLLLLPSLFILSSCSTEWLGSNVTKAILREIGTMVFESALQSFTTESKVDFGHSMAKGIWEQGAGAINSGAVRRIANAWSADRLQKLAVTTSTAYQIASPQTPKQQAQVTDAIASAIDLAATLNGYVALPTK
ncbi:MAG: hypothetical protein EBV44_10285 [Synechococcaceae bacterium WB7_1B_046]|nr:hypothetical protein [Synechococcaceae bacterium WB7_1B_046]